MIIKKQKIPFKSIVTVGILPSFLKKIYYRAKGYKIGKNVSLGIGSVVLGKEVIIADNVKIGLFSIVRANSIQIDRYAIIGSFSIIDTGVLKIGEDARINEQVIIGGMKTPQSSLVLGKRTIIMEYSFINTTMPIQIGDDSGIGGHCLLFTHGSWLNQLEGYPVTFAPITIGKMVWLPWRVFVMPGVTIGDNVVVGANSLLAKSVESNTLVAGSPARVIKENYQKIPNQEQVAEMFRVFVKDFIEFLKFNDVFTNSIETDEFTEISVNHNCKTFEIVVANDQNIFKTKNNSSSSLFIYNITGKSLHKFQQATTSQMILDVHNKTRLGYSDIGEEFVKFVSRYGLRFSRLD